MGLPKPSLALMLLLCGMILLSDLQEIKGAVACPQYCLDVDYMTCASSGDEKLAARCNCCLAPKGCTLHLVDGQNVYCA
ncbi:proteinase inhibitor PSI-1.2 [Dendrobium catenatum]|nr:proteinase inhibitor PSI-1.2 [Dendrobium catenatum]KAH0434835.1 hypothetical protein IEQ34_026742 [Dendrobium chrysotoxum]